MNKFLRIVIAVSAMFVMQGANAANEYVKTLTQPEIDMLFIHTTKHPSAGIANVAVIQVVNASVLPPGDASSACSSGLWMDAEADAAAYSMVLAAMATKVELNLHYSDNPSPWGNPTYCEILRVGVR